MAEERPPETKKTDFKYFRFDHSRLNGNAKVYQFEIQQLIVRGLALANYHIQKSAAIWAWAVRESAHKSRKHRVKPDDHLVAFHDLLYHLQNLWVRIHAYRDKLCRFINFALELKYPEKDTRLWDLILQDKTVKRAYIDNELKKFSRPPLKTIIDKRKLLSHNSYYFDQSYKVLLPDSSPDSVGARKAISGWRRKVKPEVEQADQAFVLILKMNQRLVKKLFTYYEKTKK